jgi:hypothetical protein
LGGPGTADNLFPITAQANKEHLNIAEEYVKDSVSKGYLVFYHVTILPGESFFEYPKSGWINSIINIIVGVKCASGRIENLYEASFSSVYNGPRNFRAAKINPNNKVSKRVSGKRKKR